jgi:prepilin-type N-terminal cleavage/methylation domain-containing protein
MKPTGHPRAYSLIEFAVAMVISGVIAAVAVGIFPTINSRVLHTRAQAALDARLMPVLETMHSDLQEVGGGGLAGGAGIMVFSRHDASRPEVEESDSLLTMSADLKSDMCAATLYEPGKSVTAHLFARSGGASSTCCFDGKVDRLAALTIGTDVRVVRLLGSDSSCVVNLEEAFGPPAEKPTGSGSLTLISLKYIHVEKDSQELVATVFTGKKFDGIDPPAAGDIVPPGFLAMDWPRYRHVIAREVFDFQVAAARDADGIGLREAFDGRDDDWLGNSIDDDVSLIGPDVTFLRLGIIMGSATRQQHPGTAQLFDGPKRTSKRHILVGASSGVFLRNGASAR